MKILMGFFFGIAAAGVFALVSHRFLTCDQYRQGQTDAILYCQTNGEQGAIRYELVENERGETVWWEVEE